MIEGKEQVSHGGLSCHPGWFSNNALKPLVLIVGFSFILRLGIILLARTYHDPELWEYEAIARNILEGRGFLFPHLGREYLSMRPLFVYVCVAVYWLTGWSHLAMLVVQSLASAMLAVVIFGISRSLTTSTGALLASALTAFHPALILYDTRKVHPLSIQALLLALVFLSLLSLLKSPTPWGFARLGFSAGLAFYERGPVIAVLIAGLLIVWVSHRMGLWAFLRNTAVVGACFTAVLLPWTARNVLVYGRPILVMTATWELLWNGNHPGATGAGYGAEGEPVFLLAPASLRQRVRAASEVRQQEIFRDEVLRFLRLNPREAIRLFVMKLFYFWWFSSFSGWFYPSWYLLPYKIVYSVIMTLAILGAVLAARDIRPIRIATVAVAVGLVAISMSQSVFFVEGRHRIVVEPLLFTLCAKGMIGLIIKRISWRPEAG